MLPEWFRRFGDIPGLSYDPPARIDRHTLEGHDAVPEVSVYGFDGAPHEALWWPQMGGGRTSASPAHQRAFVDRRDVSAATILRSVYEGLEVPGVPSDYHFLIQGCADELWRHRREEPSLIAEVEKLCWLDIRLVEACTEAVTAEYGEDRSLYAVMAFLRLIEIYEREGFLAEALDVAEVAGHYGQCDDARQRLMERIQAVEAETNAGQ